SPADCVREAAPWLRHVQIEDMRRGVHEHLPFGDGEIDFPPVLAALADTGYRGLTVVELPRHSHAGPHFAAHSLPFLRAAAPPTAGTPATDASSRSSTADCSSGSFTTTSSSDPVPSHGDPSATPEGSTTP